jgi:hypothetical protein
MCRLTLNKLYIETDYDLDQVINNKELVEIWMKGRLEEKSTLIESYTTDSIKITNGYYLRENCTVVKKTRIM